jgi:hypothetical protein
VERRLLLSEEMGSSMRGSSVPIQQKMREDFGAEETSYLCCINISIDINKDAIAIQDYPESPQTPVQYQ